MTTTKKTPTGMDDGARDALEIAENHFLRALRLLDHILTGLESGGGSGSPKAEQAIRDARKAMQTVFDERKSIEQSRKKTSGVAYDYAIDLDAARDEIGRRLACLVEAQGQEEVSG